MKLKDIQVGDQFMVATPFMEKKVHLVCISINECPKYPFTSDEDDPKHRRRSLGQGEGQVQFVSAESEGCTGNETIPDLMFAEVEPNMGLTLSIREEEQLKSYGFEQISEDDEHFDQDTKEQAIQYFETMKNFFQDKQEDIFEDAEVQDLIEQIKATQGPGDSFMILGDKI